MKHTNKKINKNNLLKWVNQFSRVPILVVGDLMVDRSLRGTVERISPEAPVPVIDIVEETQTAGGAGNVILNLLALGASPTLVSVRGQDIPGQQIEGELNRRGINVSGILVDRHRSTITKTRVLAGHQQVCRLDLEKRGQFSKEITDQLTQKLIQLIPSHRGVVISDYGKGVVTPLIIKTVLKMAQRHKFPIVVDPKIEHFLQYKDVDCITPNTKEAVEGMRTLTPKTEEGWKELGQKILKKLRSRSLLITRGEKGMMLFEKTGSISNIPTQAREVFDVTGAGDTVVAAFSLARAVGAPYEEAAHISNFAASLVVAKVGTAVATKEELVALLKSI